MSNTLRTNVRERLAAILSNPITLSVALAISILVVFWPARQLDFVNYDDTDYVTKNPHVQSGVTWRNVGWAFTSGFTGNWHPLTWLSHMMDCQSYGLNPAAHHLTNVALHIANAVLLFLTLWRMTRARWRSVIVAALFAWHPLHVESVAWISERKDVLSTFFWFLAVNSYISYARDKARVLREGDRASRAGYWLALFFFACGLMTKPMVITLPFVLLLVDYWPLARLSAESLRGLIVEKVPFFLIAVVSAAVTVATQATVGAVASVVNLPLVVRVENGFVSYFRYIGKTVWPVDLAVFYPYPKGWPFAIVALAAIGFIAVSLLAWKLRRNRPHLFVGWFWFAGMLVPAIGLIQAGVQSMADRYSYLPTVGLFIAFIWQLHSLAHGVAQKRLFAIGATAALIACVCVTRQQLQYWQNSETLFSHAIASTKNNWVAYNNLGSFLLSREKYPEAMHCFQATLSFDPQEKGALNLLGVALFKCGSNEQAMACFRASLARGRAAEPHNNLGNVLALEGRLDEAAREYAEALRCKSDYPEAQNNLGNTLALLGRNGDAIAHYREAIRLDRQYAEAELNLGKALLADHQPEQALFSLTHALKLKPGLTEARYHLGRALMACGRRDEAIRQFQAVLDIQPDQVETLRELALARAAGGEYEHASDLLIRALAAAPGDASLHNNLANALAMQKKLPEAEAHYRAALEISPAFAEAHYNYANILLDQHRTEQAREHYTLALKYKPDYVEARRQLEELNRDSGINR